MKYAMWAVRDADCQYLAGRLILILLIYGNRLQLARINFQYLLKDSEMLNDLQMNNWTVLHTGGG